MPYAAPYSVFFPSVNINNPTFCKVTSYTLLDYTGTIDLSSTTNPFSFNAATGEFKILSFLEPAQMLIFNTDL